MTPGSVIDDFVNSVDINKINRAIRKLLGRVRNLKKQSGSSYKSMAESSGITERRLKYILSQARNPRLSRDELSVLCGYSRMGLNTLFDVPVLSGKKLRRESKKKRRKNTHYSLLKQNKQ